MRKLAILVFLLLALYFSLREEEVSPPFLYHFDSNGTLAESESAKLSTSPYWWLDSGGLLEIHDGFGHSISGELDENNYWRKLYTSSNPTDTDNGYRPQNIFRLITKGKWENVTQEAYFYIRTYNKSESANRNESNGILLLSRYQDEDDLYYAGIRVDGHAVIKKKIDGIYYTLSEAKILTGTYNRDTEPNLLPVNKWIGLKSTTETLTDRGVFITLSIDQGDGWVQILEAWDDGTSTPMIKGSGFAGIRTDFMDVSFDQYKAI